jgi:hypothetical protein
MVQDRMGRKIWPLGLKPVTPGVYTTLPMHGTPINESNLPINGPFIGINRLKIPINRPKLGINEPFIGINRPKIPINRPKLGISKPFIGINEPKIPINAPLIASQHSFRHKGIPRAGKNSKRRIERLMTTEAGYLVIQTKVI